MVKTPKPDALKKLQGNAGKRRKPAPAAEVSATPEIFPAKLFFSPGWEPAAWLSDGAKRIWCEQLPIAQRETKLQQSALPTFAVYCDALHRLQKYSQEIEKTGATYTTASGYVRKRPEVEMRDKAANDVAKFASELNLTPKSWIGSMGTFAGRQLDMFMSGNRPVPDAPVTHGASPPPKGEGLDAFLGGKPTIQ